MKTAMQTNQTAPDTAPAIGTPVLRPQHLAPGYVAETREASGNSHTIGAGGMVKETHHLTIVWESGGFSDTPGSIAAPWFDNAERAGIAAILNAPELLERAKARRAVDLDSARTKQDAKAAALETFQNMIRPKIPADAKAVIVAKLDRNDSDSMSDYFGHKTARVVILAFSTHTRDLFPEMRKAALNFPDTQHLATAPDMAEHREKYAMGAGFYLKDGSRHSDGWKVEKLRLRADDKALDVPLGELALTAPAPAPVAKPGATVPTGAAYLIESHVHTKKGFDMWIVSPTARSDRDTFTANRDAARAAGGWYSRPWGKTPGGFAFKDESAALTFAAQAFPDVTGATESPAVSTPAPVQATPGRADKLRDLAESMQSAIDGKFADRLENTPKRQKQAATARLDGEHLRRAQAGLVALAGLWDAGEVPPELERVATKKAALELADARVDHSNAGYYDAGRCTGKPRYDTPQAVAFWALLKPKSDAEREADELRALEAKAARASIPGYFPTPAGVVSDMLAELDVKSGETVLEPSAGSGAILEALAGCGAVASGYEINSTLADILQRKGFAVIHGDFLDADPVAKFDCVAMNPPFEKGQDVEHVRRAFLHLKPGGRLVAIMGAGVTFRQDAKFQAFRDWLYSSGGSVRELPAGTFKESGTGVASVFVSVQKPANGGSI